MSLGANFSSGYTNALNNSIVACASPVLLDTSPCTNTKCTRVPGPQPVAVYPSMRLLSSACPPPSQDDFAKFPKVAVPSSVYTGRLSSSVCATLPSASQRFAKYLRYTPPGPCPPPPPTANSAGISKPSRIYCNH
jgi:hypothetical protein